jgi:hypothetical protein
MITPRSWEELPLRSAVAPRQRRHAGLRAKSASAGDYALAVAMFGMALLAVLGSIEYAAAAAHFFPRLV